MFPVLIFLLLFAPVEKRNIKADKAKSDLTYKAVHQLHAWEGKNKNADCIIVYDDEKGTIEKVAVSAKVADFDSQNSSRDSHALEVLEALKYPKVTFVSTSISSAGKDKFTITGNLTFHGITKSISFEAKQTKTSSKIVAEGTFSVLMTDYKIERPSLMFIPTNDKMDIELYMVFPL
jgi:polyisoprenoid-binding protein YceI